MNTKNLTHRVVECLPVLTASQLSALNICKGEAFANYPETFDTALPQEWLNDFVDWVANNKRKVSKVVTYDTILSSTVWSYSSDYVGPVTCCREVSYAYRRFCASTDGITTEVAQANGAPF